MNRRHALGFAGAGVAAALVPAAAAAKASRLPELIEAHKAAYQAFGDAIDVEWEAERLFKHEGGDKAAFDAAVVKRDAASEFEEEALLAVLLHRPVSADDARAKVDFLGRMNKSGSLPEWSLDALLESILPEGEFLTENHTHWALHHKGDVS